MSLITKLLQVISGLHCPVCLMAAGQVEDWGLSTQQIHSFMLVELLDLDGMSMTRPMHGF